MATHGIAASLGFSADNAAIAARDIAKGNIVINGDGNVVHPPMVYQDIDPDDPTLAKFLHWLGEYSVNYFPAHEKARVQRAPGTGGWFFGKNEYKTWAAVEGSGHRSLECIGIPGAGKTTLASSVIEALEETPLTTPPDTSIVLYAYFRHDTQKTQTITHVLASLLHQTTQRKSELSQEMKKLYKDYSSHQDLSPAHDRLIKVLRAELLAFKMVYIIVDALDEFCVGDYSLSHPLVKQLQLLDARLIITSRLSVGFSPNSYSTVKISAHADDIRLFVQENLIGHLADIVASKPGLLDEIVNTIIEKSRGMFVIARLIVNCIPDSLTEDELRATLQDLASTESLKDVYKLIMKRIQDQKLRLAQLGMSALLWVYHAKKRLTIKELRHAVSFTPGSKKISQGSLIGANRILSACAGLITSVAESGEDDIGEGGNNLDDERICQFAHFTAKEFFDEFWKDYFPDGEKQITETCLAYVTAVVSTIPLKLTERIIQMNQWGRDADSEWKHYQTSEYALYVYASTFWHVHTKAIDGMLSLDAYAGLFEHPISPYIADDGSSGTCIQTTIAMRPDHYWSLYFAGFGVLGFLQWHAAAIQKHDNAPEVPLDYNDIQDGSGWTPLHFAAHFGHLNVVRFLLDSGAIVNQLSHGNNSPLHLAVEEGSSLAVVQLLLDCGALVDEPGFWKRAPISYATNTSSHNQPSLENIRLLLQHEVDIYRMDDDGYTPLSRAQKSENPKIKRLLEEHARTHPPKRRAYGQRFPGGHHSAADSVSEDDSGSNSDSSMSDAAPSFSPEKDPSRTVSEPAAYEPSGAFRTGSSGFYGGRRLLVDLGSSLLSSSMTRDAQPQPSRGVAWPIQSSSPSITTQRFAPDLSSSLPNCLPGPLASDTSSVVRRAREDGNISISPAIARGSENAGFALPGIEELYRSLSDPAEAAQSSRSLALAVPRPALQSTGSTTTQQIPTQSTKRVARTPSPVTFHGKRMKFS